MLRPATPLSTLVFVAFVLLLISVLSTPIVKGIHLASFQDVNFGVFGYCKADRCSGFSVGYNPDDQLDKARPIDFTLPANTRDSLSSLLIVHPIAALFTLILLVLSVIAHLHGPAHSPRYLLMLLILVLPTFLLSLLAFLVDILLFVPHVRWGGWIVLAATIILAICGIITCAMRRTLASRKAHHKRIAENAEMNGENYFRQKASAPGPPSPSQQPTVPNLDRANGAEQPPRFATFDMSQKDETRPGPDERIPLNPRSPPPGMPPHPANGMPQERPLGPGDIPVPFRAPRRADTGSTTTSGRTYGDGPDGFGRPPGPPSMYGPGPGPGPGMRRDPSDPRLQNMPGHARVPPAYPGAPFPAGGRGRGGSPGPWRPPMAPGMNGNGPGIGLGPAGPFLGGPVGAGALRGPGPDHPPGYRAPPHGGIGPYPRERTPPGGYPGRKVSPAPPANFGPGPAPAHAYGGYGSREPSPGPRFRGAGPMPGRGSPAPPMPPLRNNVVVVGQAIEMDASTGSPSPSHTPFAPGQVANGDGHVVGASELPSDHLVASGREEGTLQSPSGVYHHDGSYVPARAGWAHAHQRGTPPVDLSRPPPIRREPSPVELPTGGSEGPPPPHAGNHARVGSGDSYYEDVDPRFAEADPVPPVAELAASRGSPQGRPLVPNFPLPDHPQPGLSSDRSYEDTHEMSRSPAHSDTSQYTSVSQRGSNPGWQPSNPAGGPMYGPPRQRQPPPPQQHQHQPRDVLLTGNSDFELPRGPGRGGPAGRMPAYPASQGPAAGEGQGRYPRPS